MAAIDFGPKVKGSGALGRYVQVESNNLVRDKEIIPDLIYQNHFERIRRAVARAFEGLKNTALIVGVGAAHDIPLDELARTFDKIRLVDIDLRYTRKAIDQLPAGLRDKFEVEEADLSGVMEELCERAESLAKEGLEYDEFIEKILDLLPALKKQKFPYQEMECSFVCSVLVGTQIGGHVLGYLEDLTMKRYGEHFHAGNREEELSRFIGSLLVEHIDELGGLVKRDGRIYYADHFSMKKVAHFQSDKEAVEQEFGEEFFSGAYRAQEQIDIRFKTLAKEEWGWGLPVHTSLQKEAGETVDEDGTVHKVDIFVTDIRLYQVSSYILMKA